MSNRRRRHPLFPADASTTELIGTMWRTRTKPVSSGLSRCDHCSFPFYATTQEQRFCSPRCHKRAGTAQWKARKLSAEKAAAASVDQASSDFGAGSVQSGVHAGGPVGARRRFPFLAQLERIGLTGDQEDEIVRALAELDTIMEAEDIAREFGEASEADREGMRDHFRQQRRWAAIGEAVEMVAPQHEPTGQTLTPGAHPCYLTGWARGHNTLLRVLRAAGDVAADGPPPVVVLGERSPSKRPSEASPSAPEFDVLDGGVDEVTPSGVHRFGVVDFGKFPVGRWRKVWIPESVDLDEVQRLARIGATGLKHSVAEVDRLREEAEWDRPVIVAANEVRDRIRTLGQNEAHLADDILVLVRAVEARHEAFHQWAESVRAGEPSTTVSVPSSEAALVEQPSAPGFEAWSATVEVDSTGVIAPTGRTAKFRDPDDPLPPFRGYGGSPLDGALDAMNEAMRVAARYGSPRAVEFIADWLSSHDAADEEICDEISARCAETGRAFPFDAQPARPFDVDSTGSGFGDRGWRVSS